MSRSSANWSADHGVDRASARVARTVRQFIEAGTTGRIAEVSALACAGVGRPAALRGARANAGHRARS